MKKLLLLFIFPFYVGVLHAQFTANYELNGGVVFQKVQKLYWENGLGADFTSDFLLKKHIHLTANYVTSRLGSALGTHAIKQDNFLIGANWHFLHNNPFQIFAGLNAGYFHADYEEEMFNDLPHSSVLYQLNTGFEYRFHSPFTASLGLGYNFINGDGVSTPGTLFPVFYQLKVFYRIK